MAKTGANGASMVVDPTAETTTSKARASRAANERRDPYAVEVEILGQKPLLFHRFDTAVMDDAKTRRKGTAGSKQDNPDSFLYLDSDGYLCMPGLNVKASIVEAGKKFPDPASPRANMTKPLKAGITIRETLPQLLVGGSPTKKYDGLNRARAVIPASRGAVVRERPYLAPGWRLRFTIDVCDPDYITPELLHQIVERAGKSCCLGDWRPDYGRYTIVGWNVVEA